MPVNRARLHIDQARTEGHDGHAQDAIAHGARVLVGFEGGDPARPYAGLWELGDVTRLVIGGGTQGAARHGDAVSASTAFDAWVQSVSIATGVTPPVGELGAISTSSDVVRLP